jgi:hypothetical protein
VTPGNGPDDFDGDGFGPEVDDGFGTSGTEELLLPPWERRERYGFLNGLYLTVKDVLLIPHKFFHRMPTRVGLAQPLFFAIVLGSVLTFFLWMWSLAGSSLELFFAEDIRDVLEGPFQMFMMFLFSPLLIPIFVFSNAAMMHLVLVMTGGRNLGFEATFRVVSYSLAAGVLTLVPLCGGAAWVVWSLMINIFGLYSIHEIDPWRAVVAVIGPMLVCMSVFSLGAILMMIGLG